MILVVVGPTGVGKTKMSIELAKIFKGEIVNADSMQIYKGLDIGTAKVTKKEMEGIKHHLLSIKEVTEDYSAYDYQKDARKKIEEIKGKKRTPIFVGGTGYYIKSVFYDYDFPEEEKEKNSYDDLSNEELSKRIDKLQSDIIYDKNNRKRLIRILNRLEKGEKISNKKSKLIYDDVLFIGLTTNRKTLYERIDKRFDEMVIPLIDEVRPYALKNVQSKALMTGIGYKEFYPFFRGEKALSEVIEECKKNSRNYAKRQYTWFNNQMDVKWFDVDFADFNKTVLEVKNYINEKFPMKKD